MTLKIFLRFRPNAIKQDKTESKYKQKSA